MSQDLESAEKELSQFSSKNATIDIKEQGKAMVEAAALLQGQYIAAQSELEGLKQIYTDNNVRVRAVQARIDELRHQLEKMGGKGESVTEVSGQPSDSLYPSLRKLPLLGCHVCRSVPPRKNSGSGSRNPHQRVRNGEGSGSERDPDR